ncbi:MAG: hypothetical protein LH618_04325 [Saprospiraceae bacterium]|nr:hypothetical protein [Saprospiraceae bacterium]
MHTRPFFALLSIFFIGCTPALNNTKPNSSDQSACISSVNDHTTSAATDQTVRGALLGTRFTSLEELKSVIQPEYDSIDTKNQCVRVHHCSNGREVIAVLATGTSQGDFVKARYGGTLWDRVRLLFRCPFAVINRKDLQKIYALSRLRPEWFGGGDLAFFEIAESMVENINTPALAFRNTRDSTEKGYLNSFNHITAQAVITSCFSEELADFIADAHERYRHPELITGKFTAAQIADLAEGPVDNYVDLVNNEWGQELGKQLRGKYNIDRETNWTPELLADYLNDLQGYYSWAFQIGFAPFRPEDEAVRKFSNKLNIVMKGGLSFNQ